MSKQPTLPTPKTKDMPPRKPVKGGGIDKNDNITLVGPPKPLPKVKDLPPKKDVKGGRLI
jgi:hypothetical protein